MAAQEPQLLSRLVDDVDVARRVASKPGAIQTLLTTFLLRPTERTRRLGFESHIDNAIEWIDLISPDKAAQCLAKLDMAIPALTLAQLLRKVSPAAIISRADYFQKHALFDVATSALEERLAQGNISDLECAAVDTTTAIASLPPRFLAAAIRLSPSVARQSWQSKATKDSAVIAAWHDVGFDMTELPESIQTLAPCYVLAAWPQLARNPATHSPILSELDVPAILAVGLASNALPLVLSRAQTILDAEHLTSDSRAWLASASQLVSTLEDIPVADRLLTTIAQDHFQCPEALILARSLTCTDLKGPLMRQLLQLLTAPERITLLSRSSTQPEYIAWLHAIFLLNPYITCQPSFFQPLIALYGGTLSLADQHLLDIWLAAERQTRSSLASLLMLWNGPSERPMDLVGKLDPRKTFATCVSFPLERGLDPQNVSSLLGYDPVFLLSTLNLALETGLSGLDWVELLRSNLLGVAVCALSSRKTDMRQAGAGILAKVIALVPKSSFQEQPALLRLLRIIRHAHATKRLPTLLSTFFAHALRSLGDPSSHLYPTLSAFLLRRPAVDAEDVPALYETLYAAGSDGRRSRRWIVRLIRDGCRSSADWRIVRRRHTFALLASIMASSTDGTLCMAVLEAVKSMVQIPDAARHLVARQGLLGWIEVVVLNNKIMPQARGIVLDILDSLPSTDAKILGLLAQGADLVELSRLAAIAARNDSTASLSSLTSRLCSLDRELPRSQAVADSNWTSCVSHLTALSFKVVPPGQAAHALARRAVVLPNDLGRWLRHERTLIIQ